MRKVEPNALYEPKEVEEILGEFVKLDELRKFGLIDLFGNYFGRNIIDSLNEYVRSLQNNENLH